MSLSLLGNKHTFVKRASAETRAKQSAGVRKAIAEGRYHRGHKISPETKMKMRAARLAYLASHPEERERLKQPSTETKAKIRAARLAYLASHPEAWERLKQPRRKQPL